MENKLTINEIPVEGNYETVKAWFDRWFDSEDGELVEPGRSIGGYTFSDKRRTVFEDGSTRTRYTTIFPSGKSMRAVTYHDGCQLPVGVAAKSDDYGCDKCGEYIKALEEYIMILEHKQKISAL